MLDPVVRTLKPSYLIVHVYVTIVCPQELSVPKGWGQKVWVCKKDGDKKKGLDREQIVNGEKGREGKKGWDGNKRWVQ